MRFIEKCDTPEFFTKDTESFTKWDDYDFSEETKQQRRNLREFILNNEQNGLCIYCECKININDSHIEHLKPKESYEELTFKYENLSVSCNGQCLREPSTDNLVHRCGHKKDNKFDEDKFLNPVETNDIDKYFEYDFDDYLITSSAKNKTKSDYMINTLHLNDGSIPLRREKTLKSFNKELKKIKNLDERKEKMRQIFTNVSKPFISFLKFKYAEYL